MNSPVLNILLVEDDSGDADYLQDIISDAPGVSVNITISDRLENALRALAETDFDTVLLYLYLPDSNGIETFKKIHEPNKNTPVIVLTGLNDESTALKCMQEGAQDYLDKTGLSCSLLMRPNSLAPEYSSMTDSVFSLTSPLNITPAIRTPLLLSTSSVSKLWFMLPR